MNTEIDEKTLRKNKMWVVTGKEVARRELLKYCIAPKNLDKIEFCQKVGVIEGKYDLFVSPYINENEVLCGAKSTKEHTIDGYFYSPYILFSYTIDKKGTEYETYNLMKRYGKRLIKNSYYGMIKYE